MKKCLLCLCSFLLSISLQASDFRITHSELIYVSEASSPLRLKVTMAWDNAWKNDKNHDAVWLFSRMVHREGWGGLVLKFKPQGHQFVADHSGQGLLPDLKVSPDSLGVYVSLNKKYRGNVSWTIIFDLDESITKSRRFSVSVHDVRTYGIEMVYIPEGAFYLGDKDSVAQNYAAFYQADAKGNSGSLYHVDSEKEIEVGQKKGQLFYTSSNQYRGDQKGPIPASFPKGHDAFYCMKYEITQGQYADFLNAISDQASHFRTNFGGKHYYQNRGTISLEGDTYVAASPNRPLNYVSWDDGCAFSDWAGLRPMTEWEFTKACRGPVEPVPHDYPWGNNSKSSVLRFVNTETDELTLAPGLDESQLTDQNKFLFAASYYWVMDLAGSVWERVVTVGHPKGRAFQGSHGDGRISEYGFAQNSDWPKGNDEQGGYGYRGGGYYEHGKAAGAFNPHSPVAWRPYGSWAGGPRSIAYGFRCVRSAE
jgi:formylglycine-generating enzyme required for sulfatase activity